MYTALISLNVDAGAAPVGSAVRDSLPWTPFAPAVPAMSLTLLQEYYRTLSAGRLL